MPSLLVMSSGCARAQTAPTTKKEVSTPFIAKIYLSPYTSASKGACFFKKWNLHIQRIWQWYNCLYFKSLKKFSSGMGEWWPQGPEAREAKAKLPHEHHMASVNTYMERCCHVEERNTKPSIKPTLFPEFLVSFVWKLTALLQSLLNEIMQPILLYLGF